MKKKKKVCTVDIETPLIPLAGILAINKIFCIGVKSDNNPTKIYTYIFHPDSDINNLQAALNEINEHEICVMHNGVKFDAPVIANLLGLIKIPIVDTLLLSKLMFTKDELFAIDRGIKEMPSKIAGGYSLKAFGIRFGDHKIEFEQFEKLTSEMITYCKQDVDLTYRLYTHLLTRPNFPNQNVLDLEHKVAKIISDQQLCGFYYNVEEARKFMTNLKFERMTLEHKIKKIFRPKLLPVGPIVENGSKIKSKVYNKAKHWKPKSPPPYRFIHPLPRYKSGKYKLPGKAKFKWFIVPHTIHRIVKTGGYQPLEYKKFNPGSRDQIKIWLKQDYDFEFDTYTDKGSLKVDGDQLESLGEKGKNLRQFLKVTKDLSEVVGVLEAFNPVTNSIHGKVDTIGAATHRCTHSSPNVAQTSADPIFRSFYTAPPGFKLVGADLANIEVRVLAHYLAPYDGGKYAEAVLSKDMHWYHAKLAGFWEGDEDWDEHTATPEMKKARTKSKGFFFGYLYGQGDTIRGHTLWTEGCLSEYTEEEYSAAKARVERRIVVINGIKLFPLRKNTYVAYNELLIQKTIYGKRVADTFLEKLTGIKELISDCERQSKQKGTLTAIDGRELYSRSPHSALNLLLQGSAGIVAKQWMVNYNELAKEAKLQVGQHYYQSAYVHDEFQVPTRIEYIDEICEYLEKGASMVTEQFDMNIPIKADAMAGENWSQTH